MQEDKKMLQEVNNNKTDEYEDMLKEDKDRTPSLFPIKYEELYNYWQRQRDSFWLSTEINISQDIGDWEDKLNEEQRRFIEKVLAFFAAADALVNMNLIGNLHKQIQIPEAQQFYAIQIGIEAMHCVSGETEILTDKGNVRIDELQNQECKVWNGKEFSQVRVRYTGDQEIIKVRLSNGKSIQASRNHRWYVEQDGKKEIVETTKLKPGDYIQEFELPKNYEKDDTQNMELKIDISKKEKYFWQIWGGTIENPKEYIKAIYGTMYGLSGYLKSIYETQQQQALRWPRFELKNNKIGTGTFRQGPEYKEKCLDYKEEQDLYNKQLFRNNNDEKMQYQTINISKNKDEKDIFTFDNKNKQNVHQLKKQVQELIQDVNISNTIYQMIKLEIPYRKSTNIKIQWLHFFILDHQKNYVYYNINAEMYILVMENHNIKLLHEIQLLLETLRIKSWIQKVDDNMENKYAMFIDEGNIKKLSRLYSDECRYFGYKNISYYYGNNMKKLQKYLFKRDKINPKIKIMSKYTTVNKVSPTYCFTEKKEGKGTFNNIVTGQSETYSFLIDGLVKDQKRKKDLFNGIKTIPSIKKKAEWYQRYTDDKNVPIGVRLIVQSYMEGVSFASSFCSIFWLKNMRIMNQLCTANEFISRDETLHQEFSNALYRNYVKYKIPEEEVHTIYKEATDIEEEFVEEVIETDLIGMTKEKMKQYVRYVCNYQLEQINYRPLYPGVKNPFKFMDQIGSDIKTNFFEARVSQYHKFNQLKLEENENQNFEEAEF